MMTMKKYFDDDDDDDDDDDGDGDGDDVLTLALRACVFNSSPVLRL